MRVFSIIKGPLKPNCLPNIRYFEIIFEGLGLFSSLKKLVFPQEVEKLGKIWEKKSFGFGTHTDTFGCYRYIGGYHLQDKS